MTIDQRTLELKLLPGARALLELHGEELPQRDDLCGAFCGSLALRAAGIPQHGSQPLDQDAVAEAAGSIISALTDTETLPSGELGRRDYRLALPTVEDSSVSGTTAAGLIAAISKLSVGALEPIPYSGPWNPHTLGGLFDLVSELERPATLVSNFATRHLWGAHATPAQLLDYLLDGVQDGPPPDWDVGHFACVVGRAEGPRGTLYGVADTYPSLGNRGVHLQPAERLAAALERRDMPAGGMIVIVDAADAPAVRAGAGALSLAEGAWDNGTVTAGPLP